MMSLGTFLKKCFCQNFFETGGFFFAKKTKKRKAKPKVPIESTCFFCHNTRKKMLFSSWTKYINFSTTTSFRSDHTHTVSKREFQNVNLNFVCEFLNFTRFSEFTFHNVLLVVTWHWKQKSHEKAKLVKKGLSTKGSSGSGWGIPIGYGGIKNYSSFILVRGW